MASFVRQNEDFGLAALAGENRRDMLVAVELEQRQVALLKAGWAIPWGFFRRVSHVLGNIGEHTRCDTLQAIIILVRRKALGAVEFISKRDVFLFERENLLLGVKKFLLEFEHQGGRLMVLSWNEVAQGGPDLERRIDELQRFVRFIRHDRWFRFWLFVARMMRRVRAGVKGGGDA